MPSPLLTDQVLQFTMRHLLHNNAVWNRYHFLTNTPVLEADQIQLAIDCAAPWAAGPIALCSNELTLPEVTVQQVYPTVGALFSSGPLAGAGGLAEQALPNQAALVCTLGTLFPGRRARGRTYIGGMTEAQFDGANGTFPAITAAAVATALDTWFNAAWTLPNALEPVIWSTGSTVLPSPQYYPVFNVTGRTVPGSVRSRRIGRGI